MKHEEISPECPSSMTLRGSNISLLENCHYFHFTYWLYFDACMGILTMAGLDISRTTIVSFDIQDSRSHFIVISSSDKCFSRADLSVFATRLRQVGSKRTTGFNEEPERPEDSPSIFPSFVFFKLSLKLT